jgi:hypothetical protein
MVVGPILEHTDYQDMGVQVRAVEVAVGKPEVGFQKVVETGDTEATYIVVANLVVLQAGLEYRTYVEKGFMIRTYKSLKNRSITVKRRSKCPSQFHAKENKRKTQK